MRDIQKDLDYFVPKVLENKESRERFIAYVDRLPDSDTLVGKLKNWSTQTEISKGESDTLYDILWDLVFNEYETVDVIDVQYGDMGLIDVNINKFECIYFAQGGEGETFQFFESQQDAEDAAHSHWL